MTADIFVGDDTIPMITLRPGNTIMFGSEFVSPGKDTVTSHRNGKGFTVSRICIENFKLTKNLLKYPPGEVYRRGHLRIVGS